MLNNSTSISGNLDDGEAVEYDNLDEIDKIA